MFNNLLKPLTLLLAVIPLLSSCSLFQPSTKVIEYDEEVKLHDGSMIWVHIKRHYYLVGGALGDPGGLGAGYASMSVEISWDTGVPNVGTKSFTCKAKGNSQIFTLDKINNNWYLLCSMDVNEPLYQKGVNIDNIPISRLYVINQMGDYSRPQLKDIPNLYRNIFYYHFNELPNNNKLSWSYKLNDLQNKSLLEKLSYPLS